jgi:tetratricopeptide (TPR) repeat protein
MMVFSSVFSQSSYEYVLDSIVKDKNPQQQFEAVAHEVQKYNSQNLHARLFYSRALVEIAKASNDSNLMGKAFYDLAYSYEIIGQNDLGIEACFQALKYLEKGDNIHLVGMTYNEIGLIYSASNNQEDMYKAIKHFNIFLKIQQDRGDTAEIAGALSNIGLIYLYLRNDDSAYYYSKLALDLRLKINQTRAIPISFGNVGLALYYLNKKDSALIYYKKAEDIYLKSGNIYGLNETYRNYITFYLKENNRKRVKEFVTKYFDNAQKINSRIVYKTAHYNNYEYYKLIGNYHEALKNYEIYKSYSDSINGERTKDRIANVEAVYELDKKEQQIEFMKQKEAANQLEKDVLIQQKRFYLSLLFGALGLILAIIIGFGVKRKKDREILHQKHLVLEKEKALAQSELEQSKLKEQELNTQLEYKSKQLTSHALNMMKKNKFLQEVENDVTEISKKSGDETKQKLRMLNRSIKRMNKSDKDWDLFRNYFEEVNTGFYQRLGERFPGLSGNDYKLLALIKLNMNIKESASILNISPDSVKTARYRLRKKVNMAQEIDLYQFVQNI